MRTLIELVIHNKDETLRTDQKRQITLITYRISQLHIADENLQTWRDFAPIDANCAKDFHPHKRCASSGCPNMQEVEMRCHGCHIVRYCSRECQKQYVVSLTFSHRMVVRTLSPF